MLTNLIEQLDQYDLPAPVWRTAIRLAHHASGFTTNIVLTYAQMRAICGTESDGTVRSHLHQLHQAGVLWFRRNAVITVSFYDDATRAERAKCSPIARNAEPARADQDTDPLQNRANRALSEQNAEPARAEPYDAETERATSEQNARSSNNSRGERANRAIDEQYMVGRLVGRQVGGSKPTYLPGGTGGDELPPELDSDQQRSVALLTDPDFGMDTPTAAALAQKYPFEQVRAHAFSVLEDLSAGKIRSVYVLGSRLKRGGRPQITSVDRTSALWRRHAADDDQTADPISGETAEDLRRRYIPDGYEDIIIT